MALYKVLEPSFINDQLLPEGAEVEYDGVPGPNLEPVDAAARAAYKASPETDARTAQSRAESLDRQQRAAQQGDDLKDKSTKPVVEDTKRGGKSDLV